VVEIMMEASDAKIRRKAEELIKDKAMMRRLMQKAVEEALATGNDEIVRRIERAEKVDRIIEMIIPRRYSGRARSRMVSRVKKYLRENHQI
jgi:hypothetical protein